MSMASLVQVAQRAVDLERATGFYSALLDAIVKAGRFLTAIGDLGRRLAASPPHPTVAVGSMHASTISGGEEASSYPDRCTIVVERRTIPGETAQTIEEELRQILDATAATDPEFRYSLLITASRSPFAAQPHSRIQEVVTTSYSKATGAAPVVRGEPFWTDCALLAEAGVDTVLFGVDGGGAHAATEWVTLVSLHTVTEVLAATIRSMAD